MKLRRREVDPKTLADLTENQIVFTCRGDRTKEGERDGIYMAGLLSVNIDPSSKEGRLIANLDKVLDLVTYSPAHFSGVDIHTIKELYQVVYEHKSKRS